MNENPPNLGLTGDIEPGFGFADGKLLTEEPKLSKEDPQETRHLKELLLLHLDWIQQQQEAILAKDTQIQHLKREKDALKCRLERMDRRMSLLRQRNNHSPSPKSGELGKDDSDVHDKLLLSSGKTENHGRGIKRKYSLEPRSLCRRFDDVADIEPNEVQTKNKSTITETETLSKSNRSRLSLNRSRRKESPTKQALLFSQQPPRKCRSQPVAKSEVKSDEETEERNTAEDQDTTLCNHADSDTDDEIQFMDHSARKRKEPVSEIQSSPQNGNILRTDSMYYVPDEVNIPEIVPKPKKKRLDEVLVPTWRIKHIPTGYQLEGTENLTDEAYLKRHLRPEMDEKRRKRWDAQMLREQKMLERLQQRGGTMAYTNGAVTNWKGKEGEDLISFLPDPENVQVLEVCDKVPVSAFGYPLPVLNPSEFSLPWYDLEKRSKDDRGRHSRGRRKQSN